MKVLWYFLAVLLTGLVCFFQILNGQGGIDAMISGSLLGFWLAISYEFICRVWIVDHINNLTNGKIQCPIKVHIGISLLLYLALQGLQTIVFVVDLGRKEYRSTDPSEF